MRGTKDILRLRFESGLGLRQIARSLSINSKPTCKTSHEMFYRDLNATITQQIDCLRELGRPEDAEQRWRDAYDVPRRLTEY